VIELMLDNDGGMLAALIADMGSGITGADGSVR